VLVAVELFVIGVGNGIEPRLVLRSQYRLGVPAEVGAGHRHDVHAVAGDELAEILAQFVFRVCGRMMKLVYGDQPIVERFNPKLFDGEPKGRMSADQYLGIARETVAECVNLAAVITARSVTKVPFRLDVPVGPEAEFGEWLIVEARANRSLWYDYDGLLEPLILELVERD